MTRQDDTTSPPASVHNAPMTTAEIQEKVATAKNKLLYTHLFTAVAGSFLAATLAYFALQEYNLSYIPHWYVIMIGISIMRLLVLAHYRLYYQHSPTLPMWHVQLFAVGALANAMNWGVLGSFLIPSEPVLQLINIVIIAGISAAAAQSLLSSKTISIMYLLLTMIPMTIWLFYQENSTYIYLSAGVIIYIIFIVIAIFRGNHTLTTALTLQFENAIKNEQLNQVLSHLKATQEALIVEEKMGSVGVLAAGIAHEIKNPLNFINNFSESSINLLNELSENLSTPKKLVDPEMLQLSKELIQTITINCKKVKDYGNRADNIVQTFLVHSEKLNLEKELVYLPNLIDTNISVALSSFKVIYSGFDVIVNKHYDPRAHNVLAAAQAIARVFIYLLDNAFYAMRQKQKRIDYTPTLDITLKREGSEIILRIRDNGIGIAKDNLHKIFEPFYTTKPTGKGNTGLGLSISYDIIVQQHKGQLLVESEEGVYTEFIIRLPAANI